MCTVNQITTEVKMHFVDVLAAVNELYARGFLKITPIPLGENNDDSVRYSTIKKEFIDNSEYCICKKLRSVTADTETS